VVCNQAVQELGDHPADVGQLGHDVRRLGSPARWGNAKLRTVRLASGATATAVLTIDDAHVPDPAACHLVTAAGLRVYPPSQFASKVIPLSSS
jgi:hypothetical protein